MSISEHKDTADKLGHLAAAIVTVSDTRTATSDESGAIIAELITAAGHRVAHRQIVADDPEPLRAAVAALLAQGEADFIITTGGTGISPRDLAIEAIQPLFQKELVGFGELFRFLSYQEVGPASLLSRATAGTAGRCLVFCLPGAKAAVRLAVSALILPEIRHMLSHLRQ